MAELLALLIAVPAVVLSNEHQSESVVEVGDMLPDIGMRTSRGQEASFDQLKGEKLTVIAVHPVPGKWMTQTLLQDLGREIARPYAGDGVRVISVGIGRVGQPMAGVTPVLAGELKLKETLGTGRMPRVYVVDKEGRIVWFDIEYSLSTRRELQQVVANLTGKELVE